MNIPTTLADEIKLYLKQQANNGDLEAQTLLAQLEQVASLPQTNQRQPLDAPPPDTPRLGC